MKKPVFGIIATLAVCGSGSAAVVSDIVNTKHNLSVTGPGPVQATSETEICVFCHTPHGATQFPGSPLWNRQLSGQTYTVYTSSSLDAENIQGQLDQPGGSSKLCLSCHDGTLALGTVNVQGGQQNVNINLTGTAGDGTMPPGAGIGTGSTRDLGTDLRNDHPISLNYDTTLAEADTELRDPAAEAHIALRVPGVRPAVPLEATGTGGVAQMQCASCHDPHIRDTDPLKNIKFLRLNRFQEGTPGSGAFNQDTDIACIACHFKEGWATSAHADPSVANETYINSEAALREFPDALPVWQAACLNCHDTHAVAGSRRLLREGTDSPNTPKSGGNPAIEETCYQCHTSTPVVNNPASEVKDIETDFGLPRHMPISNVDQIAGAEVHDITDDDLSETQALLGKGNLNNRHAECTDCHNPHRLMRAPLFNAGASGAVATHAHASGHSNLASGALRGAWGVEPVYGGAEFLALPTNYLVKKGEPAAGTDVSEPYLTREYQICLKCHSDYAYDDLGTYPTGGRPPVGSSGGGTPSGTNGLTEYTNQAMEFQAPLGHRGETTAPDSGAGAGFTANNHRSWHPVMDSTGRTAAVRQASAAAWLAPWNNGVGTQTMYCSDCHGSNTAANSVVPSGNNPWGPHGSVNDFILKGTWNGQTGGQDRDVLPTDPNNGLCHKCHDFQTYADRNGDNNNSGFSGPDSPNLHALHADRVGQMHCTWCHTAVPHGWKNKALLVNLNDVGFEAGLAPGTEVPIGSNAQVYNQEPYYLNAKLKVINFVQSGNWQEADCGSASNSPSQGVDWMGDVCANPP